MGGIFYNVTVQLSETLEASHVVECIEKAKGIRRITRPLIIHTDYAEENTMPKMWNSLDIMRNG